MAAHPTPFKLARKCSNRVSVVEKKKKKKLFNSVVNSDLVFFLISKEFKIKLEKKKSDSIRRVRSSNEMI